MPSLQLQHLRRIRTTGEAWDVEFKPGLNLLIGEGNTSKTTTLRIIDYCFGDRKSAREKFSPAIDEEYQAFELSGFVNGVPFTLVRRSREPRLTTKILVDGQSMGSDEFNAWITDRLGWERIVFPKGRSRLTATEEQVLSFRGVYRHIYRKADSWTSFASKEEEFWRQAVVAFLLGVANQVYRGQSVQIARTVAERQALETRRIDLRATLDDVIRRVSEGYEQAAIAGVDSLDTSIADIERQIAAARLQRNALSGQLHADPAYDTRQDERLDGLNVELQQVGGNLQQLERVLAEHRRMARTLDGDALRIERAIIATNALSSLRVSACPACSQPIQTPGSDNSTHAECYVCGQLVEEDLRSRRLELEGRAVRRESSEIETAAVAMEAQIEQLRVQRQQAQSAKEQLLVQIDRERRDMIAPLLREFETVQHRIGQLEQRRDTLRSLASLLDRLRELDEERTRIEEHLAVLERQAAEGAKDRGLIAHRTDRLAAWMNEFASRIPGGGWKGSASIDREDFAFYVGRGIWDNVLGSERIVSFLLAYHYAFLKLTGEDDIPHPRLAILDNPFQQDAPADVVEYGLEQLAATCASVPDAQVLVATRRELPQLEAHRLRFTQQFNPEGERQQS